MSDSAAWWKEADSPDPINRADYLVAPDVIAWCLERRVERGWRLGQPRAMPFPKPTGGLRSIVCLDPLAEIGLRMLLDSVAGDVAAGLDLSVLATRVQPCSGGGWRAQPWREVYGRRSAVLAEFRRSQTWTVEARADLRAHFDSIDRSALYRTLRTLTSAPWALEDLFTELQHLSEVPGASTGIPTGPEPSAILGTLALVPVDRRLRSMGAEFMRWSDDIVCPAENAARAQEYIQAICHQVELLGQATNPEKTGVFPIAQDSAAPSEAGDDHHDDDVEDDPLSDLLAKAETRNPVGVTYALGGLRARRDPRGAQILADHPWVVRTFPKQAGHYLNQVGDRIDDWDFAISEVEAPTTAENAATQVHISRALPTRSLSSDLASRMLDRAAGLDRARYAPVADHLLATAGRTGGRRAALDRRALELAEAAGELNCRRAAIGGMNRRTVGSHVRSGLRHLQRIEPELAPTICYVLAE